MVLFFENISLSISAAKIIDQYIVDFYCAKACLIMELDGGGHYSPEMQEKDEIRTKNLEKHGFKMIRFCNKDIDKNFYGVCTIIDNEVKQRTLPQSR